jgi:hypothetical protein
MHFPSEAIPLTVNREITGRSFFFFLILGRKGTQ